MQFREAILRWVLVAGLLGGTAIAVFSFKAVAVYSAPLLVLLSIAVERVLYLHPQRKAGNPTLRYVRARLILLGCSVIPVTLAQFAHLWLTRDSLFCWPNPALVVLLQLQGVPVWLMALACYLTGTVCLLRTADNAPLPGRFGVLFSMATLCTLCIAAWPWDLVQSYFAPRQIWVVHGANLLFITLLGVAWMRWRRRASHFQSLAYATLLYTWLFTYAFPFFVIE